MSYVFLVIQAYQHIKEENFNKMETKKTNTR